MSQAAQILPCPFCFGTKLEVHSDISDDEPKRPYAFHVFCRDCHCHGRNHFRIGWCETEDSAIEAWNYRKTAVDRYDEGYSNGFDDGFRSGQIQEQDANKL